MYVQNTQKKQRKNRGKTRITPIHSESECLRQAGSVGGGLVREALTDYPRQTTNLNQGHTNYHDSKKILHDVCTKHTEKLELPKIHTSSPNPHRPPNPR